MQKLLATINRDQDDIEHDAAVLSGTIKGQDFRFRQGNDQCPLPCEFDSSGVCHCGKRNGPDPMTIQLQQLALAMRGGMPMGRDDLSWAQWVALGVIRGREAAMLAGASMVRGL